MGSSARWTIATALAVTMLIPATGWSQTTQATPPPQTPAPATSFPSDIKIAFVDLQRVFSDSAFGKDGMAKVTALQSTLSAGLQVRNKDIQALSEKIKAQQSVVGETTLLTWNADLLRMQREAQFAQQEAQIQVEQFQSNLLSSFEKLVQPVIESVRKEKGLWFVFALPAPAAESNGLTLLAADPSLDLSAEVVKRLTR